MPTMASTSYDSSKEYIVTQKFSVEIQGIEVAYFSECSGLELNTEVFEYAEGGLNGYTHKLPVRTKVGNITLRRGLVQDDTLWIWYSAVLDGSINRKPITINAYNQTATTTSASKISWSLADALPVKWTGPSFKASDNAIAIEALEFACGALTRVTGG
ncbi:MAG TPA: phage tail protein [Chloroflexota bacterium]|nr:phage tail protein [Chloroflexota bacterium]